MGTMQFILGPSGSGKTRYCLDSIAKELHRSPMDGSAIILIVPEQATFQMERALASWDGLSGFVRARILSFQRLARWVISKESKHSRAMLNVSRKVILAQILTSVRKKLRFWNNCPPYQIAGSLLNLIDEFSAAQINSAELLKKQNELINSHADTHIRDKIHDLILLTGEIEKIDLPNLSEPQKYLDHYRKSVSEIKELNDALIYVDGFSGFTGQEFAALTATAKIAKQTNISLCLEYSSLSDAPLSNEQNIFGPTGKTYHRLTEIAQKERIPISRPIVLDTPKPKRVATTIIEAENSEQEAELIAGEILYLVREKDYRFRDISVVLRDLSHLSSQIQYAFDKYNIPYFLDIRRPIGQHPLTRIISSAIGAVCEQYRTKWMLKYIKTGLAGIERWQADVVENYVLANGIDGQNWIGEWTYKSGLTGREDEETNGETDLQMLNRYRETIISPLLKLESRLQDTPGAEMIIESIMQFLKNLNIAAKLQKLSNTAAATDSPQSQIHRQIWNITIEVLDQLKITLGDKPLPLDEFRQILIACFAEQTVGVIPSCLDQVLIGTIERSRHPAVRASFIPGYNESYWPAIPAEDVVLTDSDRSQLGYPDIAMTADIEEHYLSERYLNYIARTRPDEILRISYSRRSDDGKHLHPSRYISDEQQEKIIHIHQDDMNPFDHKVPLGITAESISCYFLRQSNEIDIKDSTKDIADRLGTDEKVSSVLKKYTEIACNPNAPTLSKQAAEQLFSSQFSLSQIETFYNCPFRHFSRYGLGLKPPARYKLEPVDLGQLRHTIMSIVWRKIRDSNIPLNQISSETITNLTDDAINQNSGNVKNQLLLSNARNRYILEQTRNELIIALSEQVRMLLPGRFKPASFEESFEFNLKEFQLIGRIDRIDVADSWALIIDYKTSATRFAENDFPAGVQLQLPGYLFVYTQKNEKSPAGAIFLSLTPKGNKIHSHGIINEDAISSFCSPEVGKDGPYGIKFKNGGELYDSCKFVKTDAQIREILEETEFLIGHAMEDIQNGNVNIHPYYSRGTSACSKFCDYQSLCRFNTELNKYRVQHVNKLD